MSKRKIAFILLLILITTISISAQHSNNFTKARTKIEEEDKKRSKKEHPIQRESLEIADVVIRLGMSFDEVDRLLKDKYRLSRSEENLYLIISRQGPPFDLVGSLTFTNGRVTGCSKLWGSFSGDEAADFSRALLSILADKDGRQVIIRGYQMSYKESPEVIVYRMEIDFIDSGLSISFFSYYFTNTIMDTVTVTSHIRDAKQFSFGSTTLFPGMLRSDAIKALEDQYYVETVNDKTCMVSTWPEYRLIGLLYFRNDRLSSVSISQAELNSEEARIFAQSFYTLLKSFVGKIHNPITARVLFSNKGSQNFYEISLDAGSRRITIFIFNSSEKENYVTIQEDLGK